MCVYIDIYIHVCTQIYMYIYIHLYIGGATRSSWPHPSIRSGRCIRRMFVCLLACGFCYWSWRKQTRMDGKALRSAGRDRRVPSVPFLCRFSTGVVSDNAMIGTVVPIISTVVSDNQYRCSDYQYRCFR